MTLLRSSDRRGYFGVASMLTLLLLGAGTGVMSPVAEAAGADEWISLLEGASLANWQEDQTGWSLASGVKLHPDAPDQLISEPGDGVLISNGDAVNLYSRQNFQDVELKCEFFIPRDSNSGVKLNGLYEIQIRDTHDMKDLTGDMCGGVYPRAKQEPSYEHIDDGVAPMENAAKPAGEWQTLQLTFYSPRFDAAGKKIADARFEHVMLNGREIHKQVDLHYPTGAAWNTMPEVPRGPLMLQGDHGLVAFRGIQVRPLAK
ncbi:MAG: DUF1080 domain-containing protein [Planctomycetaceae bacterium]|uniref:3-keto-alpha-glucoside-1,2-lyase/3-keto-2-hydroxy-glucal hydratase domain-containing protein n=1 Tax=Lacipirellula limnantheis TaxID=2528024 RepID=A0A517U4C6_9BACT|nr:DUF1080 domain-containing protein [Lacipirellula limnantheis]MBL9162110.1 DUF1080 domain-containing protein [Planctomycetaceae bacterium]QDT75467.1 hypothetical protein I41_46780 [Lacipirellula limnantheis]